VLREHVDAALVSSSEAGLKEPRGPWQYPRCVGGAGRRNDEAAVAADEQHRGEVSVDEAAVKHERWTPGRGTMPKSSTNPSR